MSFPDHTARDVQVVLTTGVDYWWSIDELHLYTTDCYAPVSGTALDRAGWAASSNTTYEASDAPALALDGNLSTRFSSNKDQAAGMVFKVDLGAPQSFDELVMATPNSPNDYARVFNVGVSNDGTSWSAVATCKGSSASQVVRFPAQTARYLRVVLDQGTAANYWWSIDEFNVYTSGPVPPTTTTTSTTTTTVPPRTTPTVSVSPSANPVTVGGTVSYTAKVVPSPEGGTVTFFSNGQPITGCTDLGVSSQKGYASCSAIYYSAGLQFGAGLLFRLRQFQRRRLADLPGNGRAAGPGVLARDPQWAGVWCGWARHPLGNANTSATIRAGRRHRRHPHSPRVLGGHLQRRGHGVRGGEVLRGLARPQDPRIGHRGHRLHPRRQGLLPGGRRRRRLRLRRRQVPRLAPRIHIHAGRRGHGGLRPRGGYLLVGADGGSSFGTTRFYGSLPGLASTCTTSGPSCRLHGRATSSSARTAAPSSSARGTVPWVATRPGSG